ncbi:MAG TPA: hypothetical protein VGD50_06895 [Candidatus Baltobacteraceae bacterium]
MAPPTDKQSNPIKTGKQNTTQRGALGVLGFFGARAMVTWGVQAFREAMDGENEKLPSSHFAGCEMADVPTPSSHAPRRNPTRQTPPHTKIAHFVSQYDRTLNLLDSTKRSLFRYNALQVVV